MFKKESNFYEGKCIEDTCDTNCDVRPSSSLLSGLKPGFGKIACLFKVLL